MKFRTEIDIGPGRIRIGYENRTLALGSCFAEHIAGRLARAKFRTTINPTGILFNPLSIADALCSCDRPVRAEELRCNDGLWHHFGFHGSFSAPTAAEALERMNAARQSAAEALRRADRLLLTFGTAWVYERDGSIVANCHRLPAAAFTRRRLSVEQIVDRYARLIEGPLAGKRIILTVSPVRHIGDGLEGNAVSKAVLRIAAEQLVGRFDSVDYFPAYEILTDDLRDYRFYADDLVHPAPQAVAYIWELFSRTMLTAEAQRLLPEVEAIVAAAAHRPRNPSGASDRAFCQSFPKRIAALPAVDFHEEAEIFRRRTEINS